MIITYVIVGVLAAIVLWAIVAYNGFVALVHRVAESWADIETQLKRRYDLIPNLIETVKGYAKQESSVLEGVTKARAQAMQAGANPHDKGEAENMLSGTLKSLFAVSEAYPDLKSNQNFLQLQNELADTENKIQAARRFYNGNVRDLNIAVDSFPGNVVAKLFSFAKAEFFELEEEAAREPVQVKF